MSSRHIRSLRPLVVFSQPHPTRPGARRWHAVCRLCARAVSYEPTQLEAFQACLNHCAARRWKRRRGDFGFTGPTLTTVQEAS